MKTKREYWRMIKTKRELQHTIKTNREFWRIIRTKRELQRMMRTKRDLWRMIKTKRELWRTRENGARGNGLTMISRERETEWEESETKGNVCRNAAGRDVNLIPYAN